MRRSRRKKAKKCGSKKKKGGEGVAKIGRDRGWARNFVSGGEGERKNNSGRFNKTDRQGI